MFLPSQDTGPYTDAPGGTTHGAEALPVGVIEIPFNFVGEIEARIVAAVLVTGESPSAGETGFFKRRLTMDVKRQGQGSIEMFGDAPSVSFARTSDNALGFTFLFQQGDQAGTLKLVANGVNERDATIDVRFYLSGSNVTVN